MIIERLTVGPIECNCYVVGCSDTKEGVIIDPGGDAADIAATVKKHGLDIKYILCTHGHFDHIEGMSDLTKTVKAPICISEKDLALYDGIQEQGKLFGMNLDAVPKIDILLHDGDELAFGKFKIKVIATPGHTQGGVCFLIDESLFCGDTLFEYSIGRTDLPGGSFSEIIKSIKEKIFVLNENVRAYPGHGEATTIGVEKRFNPYVKS